MKCKKCGRKLIDAQSIQRGYGPVCWGKVQGHSKIKRMPKGKKASAAAPLEDESIPGQMDFKDFPEVMPGT